MVKKDLSDHVTTDKPKDFASHGLSRVRTQSRRVHLTKLALYHSAMWDRGYGGYNVMQTNYYQPNVVEKSVFKRLLKSVKIETLLVKQYNWLNQNVTW